MKALLLSLFTFTMSVTPSQFPTLPQADMDGTETFWVQKNGVDYKVGHAYLFPYKRYVALLTQTGTNAPTAIVLENTIGAIVWSRSIAGVYAGTLTGAFTVDKTVILGSLYTNITASSDAWQAVYNTVNAIEVTSTSAGVLADAVLSKEYTQIEIRVYY